MLEIRPALSPQVDRLLHEHSECIRIMNAIHAMLNELQPEDQLLVRDCCRRITDLLCYVEHQEDEENTLVSFAFTQDLGTRGGG